LVVGISKFLMYWGESFNLGIFTSQKE